MKAYYLLYLLLLPLCTWAQRKNKDTSIVYLSKNLQPTTAKKAAFAGVAVKVDGGWLLYAIYADTTTLLKAYYKDAKLSIKQGPYTLYHPKNIKAQEGYYHNNQMTGTWRFWYADGQLKDSGLVSNNFLAGPWKSWHSNGQLMVEINYQSELSPGKIFSLHPLPSAVQPPPYIGIRQGTYKSWYSNGQPESSGQFTNNRMDGLWKWYHTNGAPATEELYKDGMITSLQCFDTTGRPTGDMCSIDKPAVLKHFGDYKTFIFENLTWPEEARRKNIEGYVYVRFTVGADGSLKTLNLTSAQPLLKKAVEDLFAQMKEWDPAISHNRFVEFTDQMTIPFRLYDD